MSQAHTTNPDKNHYGITNRSKFKKGRGKGKYYCPRGFHYYNGFMGFQPPWNYFNWKRPPLLRRPPLPEKPRPKSPSPGTEEYNLRKIQETSNMIKKQLLMPPETSTESCMNWENDESRLEINTNETNDKKTNKCDSERTVKAVKKSVQYNVEEIHNKIITHITKLNYGKKMNLICATSSGYDVAIQQIQRQKRLELSKVLRDMCSNHTTTENSDVINSIIPDIGIKIEDLPLEVIQALSSTLDFSFENASSPQSEEQLVKIKTEVCDNDEFIPNHQTLANIKVEKNTEDEIDVNDCPTATTDIVDFSSKMPLNTTRFNHLTDSESKSVIDINCTQTQTDAITQYSCAVQTDFDVIKPFQIDEEPHNLNEAVKTMLDIDKEISRLTELRQSIFLKLQTKSAANDAEKHSECNGSNGRNRRKTEPQTLTAKDLEENCYKKELSFNITSEKILVVEAFQDILVAGSESGKVFYINVNTGRTLQVINMGTLPITAFCFWNTKHPHIFISSFDNKVKEFEFDSQRPIRVIKSDDGIQCMELEWEYIFMGTINGNLLRYSLKKFKFEFEDRISQDRVLVLKATLEGGRRVLLVGTKNYPVCVRDAMSGLHMRTMNGIITPSVYSLLLENSLVYCGTTFHDILVYSFHDGTLVRRYTASNSKGVSCMKIVKDLLFASCYDGNIYVYNKKSKQYVGVIDGPGGVIVSMEITKNLVIIGTLSYKFKSLLIPDYILNSN